MLKHLEKQSPSTVGLLSALAVTAYCGLIATFFNLIMTHFPEKPGFFGFFLLLILLVFSAGVTGSIVFGYPTYLALVKNNVKEALTTLTYTALYALGIILITVILLLSLA